MFGQFVIEIRFSQKHRPSSSSVRPVMTALRSMTMPSYDLADVLVVKASTSPSVAVELKRLVLGLNTPTSPASTAHTGPTRTPRQAHAAWCHRGGFSANFSRIAACPYERKNFHREADAEEVLRGAHPALYAAFDTNFLERNRNAFVEVNASMSALAQMCGTFRGFLGEAFFGFGAAADAPYTVGSALHAAAMPNLFLQVHGEREWTLVDPSWLQYLRPTLGTSYVAALGAYSDWATLARPPHYDRIPTLTTTTRPGDVLYIPPWFLHEVVLARPGEFSFGISNRGALATTSSRGGGGRCCGTCRGSTAARGRPTASRSTW